MSKEDQLDAMLHQSGVMYKRIVELESQVADLVDSARTDRIYGAEARVRVKELENIVRLLRGESLVYGHDAYGQVVFRCVLCDGVEMDDDVLVVAHDPDCAVWAASLALITE